MADDDEQDYVISLWHDGQQRGAVMPLGVVFTPMPMQAMGVGCSERIDGVGE